MHVIAFGITILGVLRLGEAAFGGAIVVLGLCDNYEPEQLCASVFNVI